VASEIKSGLVERRGLKHQVFHMKAVGRTKRNRITRLRCEDGQVTQ
jgi:hypothetical protein